jgi:hypothetical protein
MTPPIYASPYQKYTNNHAQTRITSKYSISNPSSSEISKREQYAAKRAQTQETTATSASEPQPSAPTATFTLKTYDPVSGTCLQYETNKAAEIGRLHANLARLAKHQAALREVTTDFTVPAGDAGIETGPGTPAVVATPGERAPVDMQGDVVMVDTGTGVAQSQVVVQKPAGAPGGGGGGKKKKKGKK